MSRLLKAGKPNQHNDTKAVNHSIKEKLLFMQHCVHWLTGGNSTEYLNVFFLPPPASLIIENIPFQTAYGPQVIAIFDLIYLAKESEPV